MQVGNSRQIAAKKAKLQTSYTAPTFKRFLCKLGVSRPVNKYGYIGADSVGGS